MGGVPCPIPRCALEWHCALSMLFLALFMWGIPEEGGAAHALAFQYGGRAGWSVVLSASGIFQVVGLVANRDGVQGWAAFAGFFILFALTATILSNASLFGLPLFTGVLIPLTVSEGYVFLLLTGSRWSKSSSTG